MSRNPPGSLHASTPRALRHRLPVPVPMSREERAVREARARELGYDRAAYLRAAITVGERHLAEMIELLKSPP